MIDSIYKNEIANTAIELWHGDAESLCYVGNSANDVYSFIESGKTRYFRLTSSCDRTKEQIEAELDFIFYLHQSSVSVALPVSSGGGRFVEEIASTNNLLCLLYTSPSPRDRTRSRMPSSA